MNTGEYYIDGKGERQKLKCKYTLGGMGVFLAVDQGVWPDSIEDRQKIYEILAGWYINDPNMTKQEKTTCIENLKRSANLI